MNRHRFFAFAAAGLALLALAGYETHVALQQDGQLKSERRRAAQLVDEAAKLRRERDATTHDLAEAERELAALPPPRPSDPGVSPERRAEMKAWLARVKQMHRLFDEHPDQRIPEMQFLTEQDWLRAAKNNRLDSDESVRKALAAVRDAAAARFSPQLSSALRKFAKSSPADATAGIAALAPFLGAPVDPALLARYELLKVTEPSETASRWRVQTKEPIDPDYDGRHYVDVYVDGRGYGGGSLGAPWAWIPDFREQSGRAYEAYAAANKGTSAAGLAEVLPYFNPPLSPALAEKLLKAEREQKR